MAKKKAKRKAGAKKTRTTKKTSKKKAVHKKSEKDEVFFVGITDPIELRRTLLEASKDIVQDLQHFQQYVGARRERKKLVEELKHEMVEIHRLVGSLKKELPSVAIRAQKVPLPQHEEVPKKKKKQHHKKKAKAPKKLPGMKKQEVHELEKLESELTDIESKLGGLS